MSHVWAARALLPGMLERGEGYLCSTASAAGLLAQLGAIGYTVTKHAAVAIAEWLSMTYGDRGIRVSCLCPQYVRTPMVTEGELPVDKLEQVATILEPEQVADAVVEAIREERLLVLPHPEVGTYMATAATTTSDGCGECAGCRDIFRCRGPAHGYQRVAVPVPNGGSL